MKANIGRLQVTAGRDHKRPSCWWCGRRQTLLVGLTENVMPFRQAHACWRLTHIRMVLMMLDYSSQGWSDLT